MLEQTHPLERFDNLWMELNSTGCHIWLGSTDQDGYGYFWDGSKNVRAHRWAYENFVGPITDGMLVCHSCDRPSCVKPEHLFVGSHQDNSDDKIAKGRENFEGYRIRRTYAGEGNPRAVLTSEDVQYIRQNPEKMSQRQLGKKFGVSKSQIGNIQRNEQWRSVR